jgi:hypothetical protein
LARNTSYASAFDGLIMSRLPPGLALAPTFGTVGQSIIVQLVAAGTELLYKVHGKLIVGEASFMSAADHLNQPDPPSVVFDASAAHGAEIGTNHLLLQELFL